MHIHHKTSFSSKNHHKFEKEPKTPQIIGLVTVHKSLYI